MAENNNLASSFMDSFSCKICLEVFHDPVQCQNNEHYFCRSCITKHLGNSETCPLCMDQLTIETLRPPSRIILDLVSKLKRPRCSHVSRGCTENVQVEALLLHEETCGYAPVVCSNEGCKETVNRRDKESHETEECKFRKITCESCDEELVYVDYDKHQCILRKEMNEMKSRLDEVTESLKQMAATQGEMLEKLKAHDHSIKDFQNPLRHFSSATIQRDDSTIIKGQIFIVSGKSLEVFNWSSKTWTFVKNCMFFLHEKSFSFIYGKRVMVCNGSTHRIEFFDPSQNGFTSNVFPGSLPSNETHGVNGVLFENRIITFGWHVQQMSLLHPWESTMLIEGNIMPQYWVRDQRSSRGDCALQRFGNHIFVIGCSKMERYDVTSNELTTLTTLPYQVCDMATVAYKDNIIILGGQSDRSSSWNALNDVVMYNINSLECKRLPSMLEKRSKCAAVIMDDVIVVMGGEINNTTNFRYPQTTALKTVEYYVMGDSTWRELPAMNHSEGKPTACVYV